MVSSAALSSSVELDEVTKAELSVFQPSDYERRLFHSISIFFLLITIFVGLPIWWMTTRPEQISLPSEKINYLSRKSLIVGINVFILNFDSCLTDSDMNILKKTLEISAKDKNDLNNAYSKESTIRLSVRYRFDVQQVKKNFMDFENSDESSDTASSIKAIFNNLEDKLFNSGILGNFDSDAEGSRISADDAYFFAILPHDFPEFLIESSSNIVKPHSLVRSNASKSLIYLRSPCVSNPSSKSRSYQDTSSSLAYVISKLLNDHFVVPSKLQAVYDSVWWKGSDTDHILSGLNTKGYDFKRDLALSRAYQLPLSGVYDVTITLISASSVGPGLPVTDDWLSTPESTGFSLRDWLRVSVEPGFANLQRYVRVNVYSQYLYGLALDNLKPSKLSPDKSYRFFEAPKLSSLLNSLEAYLGHQSHRNAAGLHFVVVLNSPTEDSSFNYPFYRPLRFQFSENRVARSSCVAVVPQLGGFISVDNSNVTIHNLGPLLTSLIQSFIGLNRSKSDFVNLGKESGHVYFEPASEDGQLSRWELNYWLRLRTIESISTTCLTLTSLLRLIEKVRNMVIKSHVAEWVRNSTESWTTALSLLESSSASENIASPLSVAFFSAKNALEQANSAFFDHSLLDLLYFPTDQVFGIYVPLFVPIGLPVIFSGVAALKFFKKYCKKMQPS